MGEEKLAAARMSDAMGKLQDALGPAPIVMVFNVGKEGPFVVEMVPTGKTKGKKKTDEAQ